MKKIIEVLIMDTRDNSQYEESLTGKNQDKKSWSVPLLVTLDLRSDAVGAGLGVGGDGGGPGTSAS
jgi:hypothetical protein